MTYLEIGTRPLRFLFVFQRRGRSASSSLGRLPAPLKNKKNGFGWLGICKQVIPYGI